MQLGLGREKKKSGFAGRSREACVVSARYTAREPVERMRLQRIKAAPGGDGSGGGLYDGAVSMMESADRRGESTLLARPSYGGCPDPARIGLGPGRRLPLVPARAPLSHPLPPPRPLRPSIKGGRLRVSFLPPPERFRNSLALRLSIFPFLFPQQVTFHLALYDQSFSGLFLFARSFAAADGHHVVLSTRDCASQRRSVASALF